MSKIYFKKNHQSLITTKILIIAGSDSGGGAGVQADIKTATYLKTYTATAITCLTAQNSSKVYDILYPPLDFLKKQIEVVLEDIEFDYIKIGMLGNLEIINLVTEVLKKKAAKIPLILDPVMVSTSQDLLLELSAIEALKAKLIKNAYLVTPNIFEAEILANMKISNLKEMKKAAIEIKKLGCKNVLIKGGHILFADNIIRNILLDENNKFYSITNKRVGKDFQNQNIHGTGCTLATAITCNMAKKLDLVTAIRKANNYVYKAVVKSVDIGKGSRILLHY
jgi:hydroxymethylpyrimidine/phosphomethylpyrimidine kinase